MSAWVDGEIVPDPPTGSGPFETMGAVDGRLSLWPLHVDRLRRAAERLGLSPALDPDLRAVAEQLLSQSRDDILRLSLVLATADGERLHAVMTTRRRQILDRPVRLIVATECGPQVAPPPDVKCTPRGFYDRALAEARAAGADDAVIVTPDGQALETAVANLFALRDGVWRTPPADGGLLPGIARGLLLSAPGLPAETGPCTLDQLRSAEALAVTNAVHGPRTAVLAAAGPHGAATDLEVAWQRILREQP